MSAGESDTMADRLGNLLRYAVAVGRLTDGEADLVEVRLAGYGEPTGHPCERCAGPLVRHGAAELELYWCGRCGRIAGWPLAPSATCRLGCWRCSPPRPEMVERARRIGEQAREDWRRISASIRLRERGAA